MASVSLSPVAGAGYQSFTPSGLPNASGLLSTYVAGTTTPVATYTSSAGTTTNPTIITLNADGTVPNEIWIVQGTAIKIVITDSASSWSRTYDNLSGVNDGESITSLGACTGVTRSFGDNSTNLATTAFVQANVNAVRGVATYTSNQTLTASQSSYCIVFTGSSASTFTLPAPTTANLCFTILNRYAGTLSQYSLTILSPSGTFYGPCYLAATGKTYVPYGTSITFVSDGTNWAAVGGTNYYYNSGGFTGIASSAGYIQLSGSASIGTSGTATVTFPSGISYAGSVVLGQGQAASYAAGSVYVPGGGASFVITAGAASVGAYSLPWSATCLYLI